MINKKFLAATFTLTGAIIGAGILGLPYVFAKSGLLIGTLWLFLIGAIMTFTNLALGEITLKTKTKHQLPGYAKKYLGNTGQKAMLIVVVFGIYSALLAYLIGEGQSLSKLISPATPPILFGTIFWITMTLLLKEGLRGLKKIETWGVIAIITIIITLFLKSITIINPSNLTTMNPTNLTAPIGVIMFALLGFVAIPELKSEIKGSEHLLKKAIIIGGTIPIALYLIFIITTLGVFGESISQVATLSFGPLMTILGIFTMLTCYFVLSYSLSDIFKLDLKTTKTTNFILTSLLPLTLYILIEYFQIATFTSILGIGGAISSGTTGILILLMAKKAKSKKSKKSKIKMPINIPIVLIISTFFIISIILEILRHIS
jgi:amino acid permease